MSVQPNEALREAKARVAELEAEVEKLRQLVPRNRVSEADAIDHVLEEYTSIGGRVYLDVNRCHGLGEWGAELLAYRLMQWARREKA